MKYSIQTLLLMMVFISFLGWIVENSWLAFTKGFIDNRNMRLPFLFGYGMFMFVLFVIFQTPSTMPFAFAKNCSHITQTIIYLLIMMVLVSIGEIILGTFVEKFFGFEYWNYEAIPLHFTKYTSLPTSFGFSVIITFFMDNCMLPICDHIAVLSLKVQTISASILIALLSVDFVVSFYKMYQKHSLNTIWRAEINKEKIEEKWKKWRIS